ncbi:hypothetical protein GLAREA_01512 [Glarea lozoyensis ATCC 20868]|uniref:DUF7707 domain-containing protein n=1 Tax=Glarea lozoyensis (strain ATCC 20868 / MF5171) TaxID=1116229 RepID=S3CID1_GLAL2|nr:uncharacterized protein GLAREA_01512 [Glarea lozoyensis ATCC 20868]EPE25600.1 hypothetical protein GLAREA_01512 [Glarea lozoyensis ATCC 20868]
MSSSTTPLGTYNGSLILDPNSVDSATRRAWCSSEILACSTLCGSNAKANSCTPTVITCECICRSDPDGIVPDLSIYKGTLPAFVNAFISGQCIEQQSNNLDAQQSCTSIPNQAVLEPSRIAVSVPKTSSSTSPGTSSGTSSSRSSSTSSNATPATITVTNSGPVTPTDNPAASLTGSGSASSPTTTPPPEPSDSGLSTGAKAGIGVGVVLGMLMLAVAAFFLYRIRRKRKTTNVEYTGKAELAADSEVAQQERQPIYEVSADEVNRQQLETGSANDNRHELVGWDERHMAELDGLAGPEVPAARGATQHS